MLTRLTTGAAAIVATASIALTAPSTLAHDVVEPRPIDLAICLDTSGSMDGLIDAARQKIWAIVNDLALAEPTPDLRVALLTFGNNGHLEENGWVNIDVPFTRDLDLVSQKLFALTTNGGDEYVGRVIHRATTQLEWSTEQQPLKIVVVAGNESADQDQTVNFRDACSSAIGQDVMINSIYCGNPNDELAPAWRQVAKLSDGQFASIDQNNGTIVVTTPFDDRLVELSGAVNLTYVTYTIEGKEAQINQTLQDANAEAMNSAASAARAQTKGCSWLYRNDSWDLVDRCADPEFKLEDLDREQLPEELQAMTLEELEGHIATKTAERKQIQVEIAALGKKREAYIAEELKKQAVDGSKSIDIVLREAIRTQAKSRGFSFPVPDTTDETAGDEETS